MPPPVTTHVFQAKFPSVLGHSSPLRKHLAASLTPDIYHLHGTWLRAMYYGAAEARRRQVPYVLEVMGMYEPYGLLTKRLRKDLARRWFQDAILHHASCLHVGSPQEGEHLRRLGFTQPLAVIPVGVDVSIGERGIPAAVFRNRTHAVSTFARHRRRRPRLQEQGELVGDNRPLTNHTRNRLREAVEPTQCNTARRYCRR